jgi:hypothetical protein
MPHAAAYPYHLVVLAAAAVASLVASSAAAAAVLPCQVLKFFELQLLANAMPSSMLLAPQPAHPSLLQRLPPVNPLPQPAIAYEPYLLITTWYLPLLQPLPHLLFLPQHDQELVQLLPLSPHPHDLHL